MAIQLSSKHNPDPIHTIPAYRRDRADRLIHDLDRSFIEAATRQTAYESMYPYIDMYGFPIDTAHISIIPREMAEKYHVGVFAQNGKELFIISDDYTIYGQHEVFSYLESKGFTYKKYLGSSISFQKLLSTYDHIVSQSVDSDEISILNDKIESLKTKVTSLSEFHTLLAHTSMSDFIETMLIGALENGASDIHLEPEKEVYNLRFRLDGVLHTFASVPRERQKAIENRIKLLAGVKLNIENIPQDGRFTFHYGEKDVDVRTSLLPSNYGYSIVMRLLGTGSVTLEFEQLGFSGRNLTLIHHAINKPQGLILTTGPTGSGKTTTLYTILHELHDGKNKIITLEDPIEYKLAGISQTQIDSENGFTFASGLRSILRQDPDIVMVGEIRDAETGDVAVQASLTGHQVLSTIHTNDAAGALPRLIEMGIKGFILADSISVIIGQRLIRKLCPHCKVEYNIDAYPAEAEFLTTAVHGFPRDIIQSLPDTTILYTAQGCSLCNNTGYKGRIGVYEVLTISDTIRELISTQEPSIVQVRNAAIKDGMITMLQDGILKVLEGVTDLQEVLKHIQ